MPPRKRPSAALTPVADALTELEPDFLLCRDVRHPWRIDGYRTAERGTVERMLVCDRCGTERLDRWTLRGERVGHQYRYARGYQLRGVEGSGVGEVLRREVLRRAGYTAAPRARKRR